MEKETTIEAAWMKSEAGVQNVLEKGADVYVREQPDFQKAFEAKERTCACIDERVGGDKMAVPGSGILLGKEAALALIRAEGLKKISSHEHCGAASLAFGQLSPEDQQRYGSADVYAQEWTKALAAELGIEYSGHVPIEGEQHVARAIYYDGTGRFNPGALGTLPQGFLVSRSKSSPEVTVSGVGLAVKIALGDHGFGNQRFVSSPLLIIPVGAREQLGLLREEIDAVLKDGPHELIHIDAGIVAPAQAEASQAA